jgi:GNAT superfamily N-acetyltransferase
MHINFKQSRNIHDYRPILEGLVDDFGYTYYHAILSWCKIIDLEGESEFWEVFLIHNNHDEIIGICGLYSMLPGTEELWLGWFGILPKYRNAGVGQRAYESLEAYAICLGATSIRTYVDKAGKPLSFYYRNGFINVGTVGEYLEANTELSKNDFENMDDFVLVKDLKELNFHGEV